MSLLTCPHFISVIGSSQTILEDLCLDEGSQYNINIANTGNGSGGGRPGSLKIKDLTIVEPLDPNKAFTGL